MNQSVKSLTCVEGILPGPGFSDLFMKACPRKCLVSELFMDVYPKMWVLLVVGACIVLGCQISEIFWVYFQVYVIFFLIYISFIYVYLFCYISILYTYILYMYVYLLCYIIYIIYYVT